MAKATDLVVDVPAEVLELDSLLGPDYEAQAPAITFLGLAEFGLDANDLSGVRLDDSSELPVVFEDGLVDDLLFEVHRFLVMEKFQVVDGLAHDGGLDVVDVLLPSAEPIEVDQPIVFEKSVALATEFVFERPALSDGCPAVQLLNSEEPVDDLVDEVGEFFVEGFVVVGDLQDILAKAQVHESHVLFLELCLLEVLEDVAGGVAKLDEFAVFE